MQYKKAMPLLLLIGFAFASCKKSDVTLSPLASLNLVNATVNLGTVQANFTNLSNKTTGQPYSQITTTVPYGSNNVYGVLANMAIPLTIVATTDTTKPIYISSLNFANGSIYSLYLAGQTGAVDTVMVRETIPYYADSTCGVRFINLSYNSNPIVVTQSITPTVNDFSSLTYKQYSSFKTYPSKSSNSSYIFQVRDAVAGTLLGSYTLSTPYFHNVTLAWVGQTGGTGAATTKVIRINNY
jgi:hypothetical protein